MLSRRRRRQRRRPPPSLCCTEPAEAARQSAALCPARLTFLSRPSRRLLAATWRRGWLKSLPTLAAALRSGLRLPSAAARRGGGGCCCTLACCCSGGPRCALCRPSGDEKRVGAVCGSDESLWLCSGSAMRCRDGDLSLRTFLEPVRSTLGSRQFMPLGAILTSFAARYRCFRPGFSGAGITVPMWTVIRGG